MIWPAFACCAWLECNACDTPDDTGVIVLAVLLSALLLGNAACCFWFKRNKKQPTPRAPAPVGVRDANADAELGRLQ